MKVALIAPFKDLADTALQVKKDLNVDVRIETGDLSEGAILAKELEKKGIEIIISRGGTYQVIKEKVTIPVVEIKVSPYDILRQFYGLVGLKGTVGVVGYKNVIYGCEVIGKILGINLAKVIIEHEDKGPFQVAEIAEKMGVNVFIGDTIGARSAKKLGIKSRLITSGKEAVADAVNEAFRILEAVKREKARTVQMKTILDFVHDGIVAVNKHGEITTYNKMAESIFKKTAAFALGQKVEKVIPNTRLYEVIRSGQAELGELQRVKDVFIATNRVPMIVEEEVLGAVATFQDVTLLQRTEQKIRKKLNDTGLLAKYRFNDILFKSKKMKKLIEKAKKYAELDSTLMIYGETGTGKELFAHSLHNASSRSSGPFVAVNCAALPENLLESELFGYVEGAFTGSRKGGKMGLFELAHMGTIFLDEIGEIPLSLQSMLLRVIEAKEVMRIGGDRLTPIDVRVICATNRDLSSLVVSGKFRSDLYYRINVLEINIPPLRDRIEDIEIIAPYFVKNFAKKYDKGIKGFKNDALDFLKLYDFPGNVRELSSIIERTCALSNSELINKAELEACLQRNIEKHGEKSVILEENIEEFKTLEQLENEYISKVLKSYSGEISKASKVLGINRTTLWRKLKKKSAKCNK